MPTANNTPTWSEREATLNRELAKARAATARRLAEVRLVSVTATEDEGLKPLTISLRSETGTAVRFSTLDINHEEATFLMNELSIALTGKSVAERIAEAGGVA